MICLAGEKTVLFVFCLAAICLLASAASAAVIGSYTVNSWVSNYPVEITPAWTAKLWVSTHMLFSYPIKELFNGPDPDSPLYYNGVDVFSNTSGTIWVTNNQDDPEFSQIVSQLTDGQSDYLWIHIGGLTGGVGYPVPINYLLGKPNDFSITDLHGYAIDRIGLTINTTSYAVDQMTTAYSASVTCVFEGTPVPEPTPFTALIAGVGGLCLLKAGNRRLIPCMREWR